MNQKIEREYMRIYISFYVVMYILIFLLKSLFSNIIGNTTTFFDFSPLNLLNNAFSSIGPSIVLIVIFNSYVWHWPIIKKLCSIQTPYIAGRWEGFLKSSFTDYQKKTPIVIEITQKLNRVTVWYFDKNAVTHSIIADLILTDEGGPAQLLCVYENNPIVNYDEGLKKHIGIMELYILANEKKIQGTYFNNPLQKNTYGQIDVDYISRTRKKSFK